MIPLCSPNSTIVEESQQPPQILANSEENLSKSFESLTINTAVKTSGDEEKPKKKKKLSSKSPKTDHSSNDTKSDTLSPPFNNPLKYAPVTPLDCSESPQDKKSPQQAKIIKGEAIADPLISRITEETKHLFEKTGEKPGVAVVIVGTRPDSQAYVAKKHKKSLECGFHSITEELPEDVSEDALLEVVRKLNADPKVNGILIQLPLPKHINEERVLSAISLEKDIDGFQPENIGKLTMKGRDPLFIPCTPNGCMDLIDATGITLDGKDAVVVGRSNIVGIPAAMLLMKRNCTVQIVHSKTQDIGEKIKKADIVIAAVGLPKFVKGEWIKDGAVVIDVGINAIVDPKTGKRKIVGDVEFETAVSHAGFITPVPGGVGVMTIAKLMENVLTAFKQQKGIVHEHPIPPLVQNAFFK